MRNVVIYKHERKDGNDHYDKVENGTAKFHCWGVDYEEFNSGYANSFSTAIVERSDGTVENIPAEMIKFIDT